ncbi:hypothetical protein [uncultured Sphingomonas sp.]|uniref:hypothetical protein n=1 Tax=uncultured Sphingomonas sp. TaxID=158754 RepID=UPI0025E14DA3|nr:hypothetical protein [uncultured Sphingomonas sp.]
MRTSDVRWLAGALALASCSGGQGDEQTAAANTPFAPQNPGLAVECALSGAAGFTRDCTVEQSASADGAILTVRHPDGGFRRFRVTQDGRGVAAADGSVPAQVRVAGDCQIEVQLGDDRYRLPATVGTP